MIFDYDELLHCPRCHRKMTLRSANPVMGNGYEVACLCDKCFKDFIDTMGKFMKEDPADKYKEGQLVKYTVSDEEGTFLGRIREFFDQSGQRLVIIQDMDEQQCSVTPSECMSIEVVAR